MKKLIAESPDRVVVAEVDVPVMQEDEILVRAVRSLMSPGSELKRVRNSTAHSGSWPNRDLGYALAGVVEDVGSEVDNFKPGDRVVTMENHQQFVTTKASMSAPFPALPIPDEIDWDTAPFCIWGCSCINWMRRANIQLHENVAIVGCGLVGLLMTMWSKLVNPKSVIAVDLTTKRLELARRCGADVIVNGSEEDAVPKVCELTGGGAEVTLHCVGGTAVKAFEDSQRLTKTGGRVILIGHHVEPLTVLTYQFTDKDLLGASVGYNYDTQLFLDGIRHIESGRLPVREIITHKVSFTQAPEIYDMLINNPQDSAGILFDWEESAGGATT